MSTEPEQQVDIAIIGGGINGCGIARDAAGRGWTVALFEMGDLASATSQWSTKLIHGGLRYLEHYEFRLVREALIEREVLMRIAPHIIHPLRFVLPHHAGLRPAWLLRLGLFLYDHLGGRKLLQATSTLDLRRDVAGAPLKAGYSKGFEYSDAAVDDARLVILNARAAADLGAEVHVGCKVTSATRAGAHWIVVARNADGSVTTLKAKALVNAAGPWVADVINSVIHIEMPAKIRLVQGSHVVVPALYTHGKAYIFQNADNRIIFAIPYQEAFTLIGTTDLDYQGDPAKVAITPEEVEYLCSAASEYFASDIKPADVVWSYSGVRPLYDDGASAAQEATRDYVLKLDAGESNPALLSIFGGKITTYRRLAEEVLDKLEPHLPQAGGRKAGWTGLAPLPGGDFPVGNVDALADQLIVAHPWLPQPLASRLARSYGTASLGMLAGKESLASLGQQFGAGLSEVELRHMVEHEWARTAEDVLWRRSKLGLLLSQPERDAVQHWLERHVQQRSRADASNDLALRR
jgi:glycerol-3-phosphate dehydrogenase